jgi:hypothetical protein
LRGYEDGYADISGLREREIRLSAHPCGYLLFPFRLRPGVRSAMPSVTRETAMSRSDLRQPLCLSEIKHAHTDDGVRQEMA